MEHLERFGHSAIDADDESHQLRLLILGGVVEELVAVGDTRELSGAADTSDDLCTASWEGVVL